MFVSWNISKNIAYSSDFKYLLNFIAQINGWFLEPSGYNATVILNISDQKNSGLTNHPDNKIRISISKEKVQLYSKLLNCQDTSSPEIEPKSIDYPLIDNFSSKIKKQIIEECRRNNSHFIYKMNWPLGKPLAVSISHDIDLTRQYGPTQFFQSLLEQNFKKSFTLSKKIFVQENRYWNFPALLEFYRKKNWQVTFYFLARSWEKFGYRYNVGSQKFRKLLNTILDQGHEIGLHSSRFAFSHSKRYLWEKIKLEKITGRIVKGVRQHYLRIMFPEGWQFLTEAGFEYDSSCGYNNSIGFRAGTSFPFRVQVPKLSDNFNLYEIPFSIMDYPWVENNLLFDENCARFMNVVKAIQDNKGLLNILWHPHNIVEEKFAVYWDWMLEWLKGQEFYMGTLENILDWWKRKNGVHLEKIGNDKENISFALISRFKLENLVLEIVSNKNLLLKKGEGKLTKSGDSLFRLHISKLNEGTSNFRLTYI